MRLKKCWASTAGEPACAVVFREKKAHAALRALASWHGGATSWAPTREDEAMANVMDRWMRESLNALEVMEAQRAEHEAAMEAAMDAIRRHSSAIERLERDIAIVKEALDAAAVDEAPDTSASASAVPQPEPASAVPAASSVSRPPTPPPLRPAASTTAGPRLVAP
jgi:uncharacterized membrane protein YccC